MVKPPARPIRIENLRRPEFKNLTTKYKVRVTPKAVITVLSMSGELETSSVDTAERRASSRPR